MNAMIKNDEQRTVLSEIEEPKKKMQVKSYARLFCCVHDGKIMSMGWKIWKEYLMRI